MAEKLYLLLEVASILFWVHRFWKAQSRLELLEEAVEKHNKRENMRREMLNSNPTERRIYDDQERRLNAYINRREEEKK